MTQRIHKSTLSVKPAVLKLLPLAAALVSILFVSNAYPQTVDEIFQNFKNAFDKSENLSANFEETTLISNRKSVARGRFIFGKPNLLRKEYVDQKETSKVVQTTVLDGTYAWTYTPILNQVNKVKWNKSGRKELIPGTGASLEDVQANYDMVLVPDEFANPKGIHQIELTPKDHMVSTNVKEKMLIWVKSSDWLPVQFGYESELEDGTRRSAIVALTDVQRNIEIAPDFFKFVVPKDAEVIDLSEN